MNICARKSGEEERPSGGGTSQACHICEIVPFAEFLNCHFPFAPRLMWAAGRSEEKEEKIRKKSEQ